MKFAFNKNLTNHHGRNADGKWTGHVVRGPRFAWVKLDRKGPGFSRRLIFYFPNGSWWNFDVYSARQA